VYFGEKLPPSQMNANLGSSWPLHRKEVGKVFHSQEQCEKGDTSGKKEEVNLIIRVLFKPSLIHFPKQKCCLFSFKDF
jgi:hypothetical protein